MLLKRVYTILNLISRTFYNVNCVQTKTVLYLSLVRFYFQNSSLCHPHFIRDITTIKILQQRATKYILCDFSSDYKSRLIRLKLLPLMMTFELQDVFFIKSFKEPSTSFDIRNFIQFSSSRTRSATYLKMKYLSKLNSVFYFNRLPQLWNSLPPINLDQPLSFIKKITQNVFLEYIYIQVQC